MKMNIFKSHDLLQCKQYQPMKKKDYTTTTANCVKEVCDVGGVRSIPTCFCVLPSLFCGGNPLNGEQIINRFKLVVIVSYLGRCACHFVCEGSWPISWQIGAIMKLVGR